MSADKDYKGDYRNVLPVRWINRELWAWLRAYGELQQRTAGELINELIDGYLSEVGWSNAKLTPSSYEPCQGVALSIRGLDRELWRRFNARALLEGQYAGRMVNALIERFMIDEQAQRATAVQSRRIFKKCVQCQELFEPKRKGAMFCSAKCRVSRHRQLRIGR